MDVLVHFYSLILTACCVAQTTDRPGYMQLTKSTQTLIKITLDHFYLLTGTGIPSYSILICGL